MIAQGVVEWKRNAQHIGLLALEIQVTIKLKKRTETVLVRDGNASSILC